MPNARMVERHLLNCSSYVLVLQCCMLFVSPIVFFLRGESTLPTVRQN